MMECIVCRKSSIQLFNIFTIYGTLNHKVFDDITEIFGKQVKKVFDKADCVCHVCMNMLDNIAKLKRHIWSLITNTNFNQKPVTLGKIWNVFASLQLADKVEDVRVAQPAKANGDRNDELKSRSPTPSLLLLKYTEDYETDRENRIAQEQYQNNANGENSAENLEVEEIFSRRKRFSKTPSEKQSSPVNENSVATTSSIRNQKIPSRNKVNGEHSAENLEVEQIFSKRKNNRWTPRDHSRPTSVSSIATTSSTRSRKSLSRTKGVQYDEQGRLIRKRTRSVSRAQEEELEQSNFTCQIGDCPLYFNDFDVFNQHMIEDHNSLAVFYCQECGKKYISAKLLQKHEAIHDNKPFFCPMCAEEVCNRTTLQAHLAEHLVYSVRCKHCDKFFLSGSVRDAHTRREHQGKRKRSPVGGKLTMEIFDYGRSLAGSESNEEVLSDHYEILYMCYSGLRVEGEDLDVTAENMREHNVEFYSEGDLEDIVEDACS